MLVACVSFEGDWIFTSIGFVFLVLCCCVGGYLIGGELLYVVGLKAFRQAAMEELIPERWVQIDWCP